MRPIVDHPQVNPESVLLNGKVAVVTGGGTGICRGIAQAFVAFGARVAILERDPERAARVAGELEASGGETLHVEGGTHAAGGWYHHPRDGRYVYGPLPDDDRA